MTTSTPSTSTSESEAHGHDYPKTSNGDGPEIGAGSIGTALSTGKSLVLLQLLSRLLTFVLNQSLVRLAPPEVFGTAAIQFDLIYTTILFLSREGIRNALLRSSSSPDQNNDHQKKKSATIKHDVDGSSSSTTSLARLPFKLGLGVSGLAVGIYLYYSSGSTTRQPDFLLALGMYVVAALVELGVEPLYLRALSSTPPRLGVRVQAEGGMAIVKAVVTFGWLFFNPQRALLGFALGQLAGDGWLTGRYIWEFGSSALAQSGSASDETFGLAMANTGQSVVKHLLTEGDRIVIGRISPLGDQGGYAIAINYGSLIARIIFQPLEETLLLHFSRSLGSPSTRQLITYVLHISLHLLLFLPAFLPPVLPLVIPILLPARYRHTTAPSTLETYLAYYIPLLSLNGILEAFHASSATPAQISKQARWMMGSSASFAVGLWGLTSYRPRGLTTEQYLVIASCLSMVVRIIYAARHLSRYFYAKATPIRLSEVLPHPIIIAVAMSGAAILRSLRGLQVLGATAVIGLVTLITLWVVEKPRFMELRRTMQSKE